METFYLSALTFGGGYVIVSLMRETFVKKLHWIDEEEMLDLVAIAQSSPGPIAVNGAVSIGYKLAGLTGVLVGVLGTVIPPFIIIVAIAFVYEALISNTYIAWMLEGMQAGIAAVIASVVYDMATPYVKDKDFISIVIMVLAFTASCVFGLNLLIIIVTCILLGILESRRHAV